MKKILSLIILFFVFGIENISAQISKWADEKYVNFLTCLNVNDDYYGAKAELIRLSEQGDSQAKCCLATMLCFGEKNDRNYEKALELLKESAEDDYERSEYLLGSFGSLEKSHEVMRMITGDDSMTDTADDGFWKQCFKVSRAEVETFKDVFKWFLMDDGDWGYRDIMYFSAVQYLNGSYGLTDVKKALKWLSRSKELGSDEAARLFDKIIEILSNQDGE